MHYNILKLHYTKVAKIILNVRVEELEMQLLEQYCKQAGRTKTDVVRTLLRGLKRKLPQETFEENSARAKSNIFINDN